jgi:hypothetical protein
MLVFNIENQAIGLKNNNLSNKVILIGFQLRSGFSYRIEVMIHKYFNFL